MTRARRTVPTPSAIDYGTGAIPVVIEDVAEGTRSTIRRARRADPLSRIDGCTPEMRAAAAIYRQAVEHCEAGRGMGPLPWAIDRDRRGDGGGAELLPQERAMSAAEWARRGDDAMGNRCAHITRSVVVSGVTLLAYENMMQWRRGGGRTVLLAGLDALAGEYGC